MIFVFFTAACEAEAAKSLRQKSSVLLVFNNIAGTRYDEKLTQIALEKLQKKIEGIYLEIDAEPYGENFKEKSFEKASFAELTAQVDGCGADYFVYTELQPITKETHFNFIYFDKNVEVLKRILENVHKSFKARTASDKARKGVMKQLLDVDTKSKLAACSSKKSEECEIYIVEGDSAGGTVKTARNRRTQAVLPLRGKILNVEKAPLEKILVNNEIKTMIAAFGCGIGENFDIKKLRYDKIIILTDADVDGAHISTLLLTFFYRFMPELIYQGKVYRGLPPLYRVSYEDKKGKKKNKVSEYLFNDFELEKFRKTGKKILELQRYKGLGEMDDTQLWETTLDPESRILAQVSISDTVEADEVTDILMGSNVPPRRQFIMDEAKYANLDI